MGLSGREQTVGESSGWRGPAAPLAVLCWGMPVGDSEGVAAWPATTFMLALAGGVIVCLILVAITLVRVRRQRLQIEDLVARLDKVEPAELGPKASPVVDLGPLPPGHSGTASPTHRPTPSGDVLAGRTSYIEAMVEGASAEAKSLSDRVILCIHDNLHRPLTPGQLAEELRVSLRTLQRVLAATLDCTPRQLIFAMKMRAARRLLLSGDYRVNEVAYRLGFSSPGHFSTRFRSFYRMPPSRLLRSTRDLHAGPERDEDTGVVN